VPAARHVKDEAGDELKPVTLRTNHLHLIAATFDHVCAEIESPEHLACFLGVQIDSGWPPGEYDGNAQEFFRDRLKEGGISVVGWYGWYAVLLEAADKPAVLVGAGGYFGPPNEEGEVEIGFSVMPSRRDSGYATEMVKALIINAFTNARVQKIVAHTTPQNAASLKVLMKCGFRYVCRQQGSGNDLFEILRN